MQRSLEWTNLAYFSLGRTADSVPIKPCSTAPPCIYINSSFTGAMHQSAGRRNLLEAGCFQHASHAGSIFLPNAAPPPPPPPRARQAASVETLYPLWNEGEQLREALGR